MTTAPGTRDSEMLMDTLRRKALGLQNLRLSNVVAVTMCGDFSNLLNLRLTNAIKPAEFVGSLPLSSLATYVAILDIDVNLFPEEMRYLEPSHSGASCVALPFFTSFTLHGSLKAIRNVLLRVQLAAPQVLSIGIIELKPNCEMAGSVLPVIPCFEAMVSQFRRLQGFLFKSLGGVQTQNQPLPHILEPPSKVKALRECRVYLYRENLWGLGDKGFIKMSKAWPNLKVLHLAVGHCYHPSPRTHARQPCTYRKMLSATDQSSGTYSQGGTYQDGQDHTFVELEGFRCLFT